MFPEPGESEITILIVDNDLGFLFWLGSELCTAGYVALPAEDCQNARRLLNQLQVGVRLLLVNYGIIGTQVLASELLRANGHLKVIALLGDEDDRDAKVDGADAWQRRNSRPSEWLQTIQAVLEPEPPARSMQVTAGKPS